MNRRHTVGASVAALVALVAWSGCGGGNDSQFEGKGSDQGGDGSGNGNFGDTGDDADAGLAAGGEKVVFTGSGYDTTEDESGCASGTTTISGKVYDPAGKNPLYNVVAYVPKSKPSALTDGATCNTCKSLYTGAPIVSTVTDASGSFTLTGAPSGKNVPLVIQVGKWRKQITIPTVTRCKDNPQADKSLRLPKNRGEGDIPSMAISTGGADTLECLLHRMGVDDAEYTPGNTGKGRIHIFQGSPKNANPGGAFGGIFGSILVNAPNTSPAAPSSSAELWDSSADMLKYDMVLLSCEGSETTGMKQQSLVDYANAGGRVFASHFHYAWFNSGPWAQSNLATWTPQANVVGQASASVVTTLPNGGAFPKGQALQTWLTNVGALQNGKLPISYACHNADWTGANTSSQAWLKLPAGLSAQGGSRGNKTTADTTEYLSFNTPIGKTSEAVCGRVVYSDLHVGASSGDQPTQPVPQECSDKDLSPEEKVLEFMLFDLAACVTPDDQAPPTSIVN